MKRNHNRIVHELYQAIKKCEDNGGDIVKVLSRYGKQTRKDAIEMLERDAAERMGVTYEEFHAEMLAEEAKCPNPLDIKATDDFFEKLEAEEVEF